MAVFVEHPTIKFLIPIIFISGMVFAITRNPSGSCVVTITCVAVLEMLCGVGLIIEDICAKA
jgi:hypothetical protein